MSLRLASAVLLAAVVTGACAHTPEPTVAELIAQGKEGEALVRVRESQAPPAADPGWGAALARAAHAGSEALVRALLEAGAEPNLRSTDAQVTPLHFALDRSTSRVYVDVTRVLLERGADPRLGDRDGATPLHYLAGRPATHSQPEKETAMRLLLDGGASAAPAAGERSTVLALSAGAGDSEPILRLLIAHGAEPLARGKDGLTPLDGSMAARRDDLGPFWFERGVRPREILSRADWPLDDLRVHREFEVSGRAYARYADWERARGAEAAAREADRAAVSQLSLAVDELIRATAANRSLANKEGRLTPAELANYLFGGGAAQLPITVLATLSPTFAPDRVDHVGRKRRLDERAEEISRERVAVQLLLDGVRTRSSS